MSIRASNLVRYWKDQGYTVPVLANVAIKYRGVGLSILAELIKLGVVLDPYAGLSARAKNALYKKGLLTREQVSQHNYFAVERMDFRGFRNTEYKDPIRDIGFKSYLEICDWLGKK